MRNLITRALLAAFLCGSFAVVTHAQEAQSLILRIKAVGREGAGNVEAAKAFKQLIAMGPSAVPDVLAGMDDANPIALNWLRAAIESIQDKAIAQGQSSPNDKIEAFLLDTRHAHKPRRLAYEYLVRAKSPAAAKFFAKMITDPSPELRREAVAAELKNVQERVFADVKEKQLFYEKLLTNARDLDQVGTICKALKDEFNIEIDQTRHFGFVTHWQLVGPFDNSKGVGFHNVFPPEKSVDTKATYEGKNDQKIQWREYTASAPKKKKLSNEDLGLVDFNEAVGKLKGTVAYAYAVVTSKTERPVEIRVGSNNAVRYYLNGKEVFAREEYHHGFEMDQHIGKGTLKAGRNEILVKVCQNEQTDNWAELWSFQLRICDHLGAAVPVVNVTSKSTK
jgi:hypothetical protein